MGMTHLFDGFNENQMIILKQSEQNCNCQFWKAKIFFFRIGANRLTLHIQT